MGLFYLETPLLGVSPYFGQNGESEGVSAGGRRDYISPEPRLVVSVELRCGTLRHCV